MELDKCHLLFGCEIMKFFSTGLLLLIVFGSLEGSTIPHKRTVRALNATIQTHFNGTIQRTNPCTNKEVERSSYRGCHEFHHHSKESNWSDYSHKCATLISNFFQAISNLVTFKDRQSGTFDLNINTKVSHKTDGSCADTKKPICPTPTVIVESTDCEVLPSASRNDLSGEDTHVQGSEICSLEEAVKVDEQEKENCSVGSEISVNEEPQTQGSSAISENDKSLDVPSSGETIPKLQPTQEVNPLEVNFQSEEFQPETIPTYDNYPTSDHPSESSFSNNYDDKSAPIIVKPVSTAPPSSEAPSTVITSAPKEDLYIDISETPQQTTGTDSAGQETPSDSKDYASDYKSQTDEDKTEIQPTLSVTQPENSNDKVVPEDNGPAIEFSDKIALYNVRQPQQESSQTISPWTQHYYSDTTIPLTYGTKSDYDVQDIPENTQPTTPPQYQSDSYDEQIQSSQAVTFAPVQPEPENYVNQYDQVASDSPTSSPPKDEGSLEFSDQLAVYNVRQPQAESPSSSSLLNEPTSIQPPVSPESHSENYVNYEDGLVPNQLPTSISPPKGDEPSVEFSDQLAVYNVRQPYSELTSIQPTSSESQTENYDSYEDETESNESTTSSSPSVNVEPSVEFSDQLAVYNIRVPTTTYPPSTVSQTEQPSVSSEAQPANYVNYEDETVEKQSPTFPPLQEPSIEFSDQLAVYNVREPLPGTTTLSPIVETSIEPSPSQSDNYMNYETEVVPSQIPSTSSPQPEDNQYLEYSDQLAVYNVREPLSGTTTSSPVAETSIQPSSSQSDNYMNYETEVVPSQIPTTSSPQPEPEQYVEYSDQLAVYNVREPLPTTTASSPAVSENILSGFVTTLSPSFSSYELDTYDSQKTEVEPQPTFAPVFEEVTSLPQPSNVPYYGDYNEQSLPNQMSSFTTPAGNVYPTTMPSSEYIDNNGPESPSSDYSSSKDIGGYVSTSLPSSSDDTTSFNNIELQYESQPTSTLLPSEAQQNQVFSDQVSDIREPQSDSSVSDEPIYDMVTAISPVTESESSIPYDDGSSLTDSQQIIPSESQQETSITNEYPESSSSNQSPPNNYEIYDEQSSTSENEAPMPSTNEPITYQQSPIDVITTSPSSTETENFGAYDDSKYPAEPQGTYPPKIEKESFANYDDNNTSTTGQASVSIEPVSDIDSSENESMSSEEGSSSQEEDGNVTVGDDQGLLPLSSNTFRPTVQIETTVNYADQTPFRPIGLSSSFGPLQENNIIYDEGVYRNETEPSALGGEEEADNSLNVSSELTKQNEGKEFESSTSRAPEHEIDTYYEETFKQPTSSDVPKINNYVNYEDDVQPSSPKFDLNTTVSNDYSTSFLPSTPSLLQEIITTPSTSEAMPETYTDYDYSKTDFNSQTTFPPQTESVIYDDPSSQDQYLKQQQSADYSAYDNQIQSTASPNPADQEVIEFSDQLSIYNVPETALESSPALSELFSSNMVTTTQPTIPSDGKNSEIEFQPTFSPSVEPQNYDEQSYTQPLPSKDLNLDTYVNYEDTTSSQLPTTPLPPNEVEPSLEYSDQLAVYNVQQPQTESPSSSSLLNEPTSIQPPVSPESHSENYVNYEDGLVPNQLPTSISPPKGDEPSVEFSDQLAVYNVRQPSSELTSIQPTSSESQTENYDSYEDETEPNESTTSSSPSVNVQPSVEFSDEVAIYNVHPQSQFSSPSPQLDENIPIITISTLPPSSVFDGPISDQPTSPEAEQESEEDYEDEIVSTTLPSPKEEPSIEFSDELAIYNVRQPSTVSPLPSVSYVESSSAQSSVAPQSQPDNYVSYDDEKVSNQTPTTSSPQPEDNQYVEYSDQLAVYNVREPLSGTTTSSPGAETSIQPSSSQSDNYMNYETEVVPNQIPTTSSPQPEQEQYVEYSDQLAVYNVREPLPSTTTSSPDIIENIPSSFATTLPPLFSSNRIETYDEQTVGNELQPTVAPEMYDEPTSAPATSFSPPETQPESYVNYESGEFPTSLSPPKSVEPFVEYSDELSIYNVRQPEYYSSSPSPVNENLVTTTVPNLPSDDLGTNDSPVEVTDSQPTLASESGSQVYDEPTSSPASSDVYTNYDETVVSNEFQTSPSPVKPSLEITSQLDSSSIAPSSSSVEEAPFLQYSDQFSIYNARQPSFETTASPSPSELEDVSSGAMAVSTIEPFPSSDSFQVYDPRVTSSDYVSTPPSQLNPESQLNYEDYTVQKEESSSTLSTSNLAQSQDYSVPPSHNSAEQEFDYQATSPPQSQDNYIAYEDQTVSNALTTLSPLKEVEPSLEYSDQLAVYNVREPVFESTTPQIVSDNIPSSITTLSPPSLADNLTSPQPSSSEPQSDSYEEYEDETVGNEPSTTLSPLVQTEPSVEYSDQLAAFNVLGPAIVPISAPEENISSGDVTTSLPSSLNDEPTSPQASSSESQSDSVEDYEDETVSTPSPVTSVEPSIEVSDELSIYNVRQRPSQLSTSSPLSEYIASEAVTTFAPYLPSNKFESYDYQPVGFESQPTFSPESESPEYNQPISVPNISSQPQDDVNYENEIESNEPMTTLRPPVDVEYSDELAIYNVRSPFIPSSSPSPLLNENIAVDTVSTFMPAPVYDEPNSILSISPEEQPDNFINYEDQLASNTFPITYSPSKDEPSVISSDQLSVNTTSAQSLPSDGYDYDSQVEYTDSQTTVPAELAPQMSNQPTTVQPLTSSDSQPEQYVNYEDERISTPLPTSTSSANQVEPSVEYSDELAAYNVREPLAGTTTSSPVVESSIQPSSSQLDNYMNYETEVVPNQIPTTSSPQPEQEQYLEYSDQLAVYNVREPLPGTTIPSPVVSENDLGSVVTTLSPSSPLSVEPISLQPSFSESQSDSDDDYEDESNESSTTLSTPGQVEPSIEVSDELAIYNVRQPEYYSSSPSPLTDNFQPQTDSQMYDEPTSAPASSSESKTDEYLNYEDKTVPNQLSSSLSPPTQVEPSLEYSDQLAVYNVRQPEYSSSPSPLNEMVTTAAPSHLSDGFGTYDSQVLYTDFQPTSSPQSDSQIYDEPTSSSAFSESKSENYVNYEDKIVSNQASSSLSPPVQVEPSVEYSDELAVYNVREPLAGTTIPSPVVGENVLSSVVPTFPPSSSLIVEQTSPQSSSSESQSDSDEDYEDETVSTPSPATSVEPSLEVSDELSIYNVRQRPSEMTTPSPFNNNVINSLMTTISPYFTFKESSSQDSSNTISQTTESPEYVSDMYDEESSIQPSKSNEDDSQALSDETTPNDSLPETLSNFAEQTVSNVIQSTQSPDLSNQLFSKNEVEPSFITVQPNVESPVISDSPFESSAGQEFDYQPTFSPDYETPTMTTPSSSRQSQDNYVVYEDQTVFNELTTSSPVTEVDYYNDQNPKPEESSALPPSTEIDTDITLTELGPTFPPNFESQIFDKSDPIQHTSSEIQPNYVDYEDSVVSNQTPTSPSPQTEVQPSIEYSDQLAVYNVRQPYFEPTTSRPSSIPSELQPENYDTYEDQVTVSEQSTPQKVESTVTQPTFTPERETQIYNEATPATSSEPQPEQYVNYEDERISTPLPTSASSANQVEPSVEYSDELAVYNVRESLSGTTTLSPVVESSIQPSSSQSDNYMNYETEVVPNQIPTTSSPQPEDNQYVEYSDQLAVYNVREPLAGTTTSSPVVENFIQPSLPVVSENVLESVVTTLSPSSPLSVEPISLQPSSSESQSDSDDDYENESNESSTTLSTPGQVEPSIQVSDELSIYNVGQPSTASPLSSVSYVESSSPQPSVVPESQPDNYVSYDDEKVSNQTPTTSSPQSQDNQYVEYSDQLAVYNVREPLPGTTTSSPVVESSIQPFSPVVSESNLRSVVATLSPSSPLSVGPNSAQPTSQAEESEEDYEDEIVSTTLPSPKEEPSVEVTDELAIYNVRQPSTASPLSSVSYVESSSAQPSVTSQSQPDNYVSYDDEKVSNQTPTTSSPQPEDNQYVEYSDQLAVYNVREPLPGTTIPSPVVSENVLGSMVPTFSPSSSLIVEPISLQPSSSESQSNSDEDYEDVTVSTASPVTSVEPSLEVSDELSIYNVRQRPSEMSTPSPFNNNFINNLVTTISPYFTSSSNDNEGSTFQSLVTSEPEPEIHDQPYSASSPSSESTSSNYVNSEDEIASGEYSTSSPPPEQLSIYNVHQRPSDLSSSSLLIENLSDNVVTTAAPSFSPTVYDSYDNQNEQNDEPKFSPEVEPKSYDDSGPIQNSPPASQPENYVSYDDEVVSNGLSTSSPPTTGGQPSIEFSDELAIYNVRQPSTASPLSSVSYVESTSPQPSVVPESQPDNYISYDDERLPNQIPTTLSPQSEGNQYVEYSDELAVYNVREPLPSTTASSPAVNVDFSNSVVTTSSPFFESDKLLTQDSGIGPIESQSTSAPQYDETYDETKTTQSSIDSQPGSYQDYEGQFLATVSPSQDTKIPISNSIVITAAPSLPSVEYDTYDNNVEYTDSQTTVPTELTPQISNQPTTVQPLTSSESQPEQYVNYEDERISTPLPTSTSSANQVEPSVEYSDELAVYNVREPLPGTTTSSPVVESSIQPSSPQSDNYINYETEVVPNQIPTTSSPQPEDNQYVEYSDQLAVYNVREPLTGTTIPSPVVSENDLGSVVTTLSPSSPLSVEPISLQPSSSESQSDSNDDYEDDSNESSTTLSTPGQVEPSVEFSDELAVYNVREPLVEPTSPPTITEDIVNIVVTTLSPPSLSVQPISIQPSSSNLQSDSYSYEDYNDETVSKEPPTTFSTPVQVEPSVEYSDQLAVYNVREPLVEPTSSPVISENNPGSVVATLSPSSSESQSDSDDYEDESNESSTTLPTPGEVEPSIEVSDELAIYNVGQPSTASPLSSVSYVESSSPQPSVDPESQPDNYDDEQLPNQIPTTLSPQSEGNQYVEYSDELEVYNVREPLPGTTTSSPVVETSIQPSSQSDINENYEDEVISQQPSTSSPKHGEDQYVEYSDELAVYNVRQPDHLSSPSPLTENFANDLVTTAAPSFASGDFETYDNQVVYTDFQPTFSPPSDSQTYDEPTSTPASSSQPESDNYVNYEDKMVSNVAVTSASPPVDVDIEYSDELAIYNVRQPSTLPPLMDIATILPSSVPESDSNVFTTLSPSTQNSVQSEQDDFYTYDDRTQSSDSQTTFSPEIEYDEGPTSPKPQSPSLQPLLETMATTFQPLTESQKNKTNTPSKQQEVSTFPPLYPFVSLNQPSYSLPVESKLVSEQQDQLISNQVVNSPLVPSSELDSDKRSNNLSNLVKSQETRPTDGVENTQRDTPQPEPFALVPDQSNPSNEPGEEYVSCTCTRGNGRATQHTLMCPFNPVLKGNMTAPSYYILISKLSGDSGNQSLPDEDRFQVEKVYLGDGTPLNCTEERKPFPTSKYTPVPISSSRTVKLPIRLNNA